MAPTACRVQGELLGTLHRVMASSQRTLDGVLGKARFWQRWTGTPFNARQAKPLNRLLDGFDGRLTSSRWASIAKCSADTALRDITRLIELGGLRKGQGGGRSTAYELTDESTRIRPTPPRAAAPRVR